MMEKTDSLATVTVKEFPDNESYTTEAPPAYRQHKSTAVQVAKIVAVTVIVSSAILGSCLLASAWIQARATCELMLMEHQLQEAEFRAGLALLTQELMNENDENEITLLEEIIEEKQYESFEKVQDQDRPSFQALIQDQEASSTEAVTTTPEPTTQDNQESSQEENQENDVHRIKLPLQLDFDDIAGSLMEKNQRAHMNCVVEKRRSEELVDHAPRSVQLPFGLNLTTAPRLEHLTGERMVISCESGQKQERQLPMPPMMVPLPGPLHLPLSFHGGHNQPQGVEMHDHMGQQQHPMEHMEVIVAHHVPPPVPLSAMTPPQPQHQEHQQAAESRAFPGFPIPVQMREMRMAPMPEQMPQQMRPHFVQPRSVPSNPDFLQEKKRVKRCACNCDC